MRAIRLYIGEAKIKKIRMRASSRLCDYVPHGLNQNQDMEVFNLHLAADLEGWTRVA